MVDIRIYDWALNSGGEGYLPAIPASVFHAESHKFLSDRADSLLEVVSQKLQDEKISFEVFKEEGAPVDIICEYARKVDLVIMGARGDYERWGEVMLGMTIESASRQCSTPLMIVDRVFEPIKSVICAYDQSDTSNHALKFAAGFARDLNLPIEVVNVNSDENLRKAALAEADSYLAPYGLSVQLRHEAGEPSDMLIQTAKDQPVPSLLVMGGYGHSRIREAIIGSTTVQVMRKARKPILLAK